VSLDPARWYPVAASDDLPQGHVYQTMLGGHGLAIWRAASGRANIWEDRCPHRGVRLSVGIALGEELRCQYHAWRFASGSGACTHIPAQPTARPAAAIRATIWPVAEQSGLVWSGIDPQGALPEISGEVLRAIPVDRATPAVEAALEALGGALFFVQPVAAERCVIRGVAPAPADLRALYAGLERLRDELEAAPC
jgi:phenylpropionate dioxygenase-like ring-hydroxylating dioxygenase large terminal subunit